MYLLLAEQRYWCLLVLLTYKWQLSPRKCEYQVFDEQWEDQTRCLLVLCTVLTSSKMGSSEVLMSDCFMYLLLDSSTPGKIYTSFPLMSNGEYVLSSSSMYLQMRFHHNHGFQANLAGSKFAVLGIFCADSLRNLNLCCFFSHYWGLFCLSILWLIWGQQTIINIFLAFFLPFIFFMKGKRLQELLFKGVILCFYTFFRGVFI